MMSKASTVVQLFAKNNMSAQFAVREPTPVTKVHGIALHTDYLTLKTASKNRFSWLSIVLVILAHAVIIYALVTQYTPENIEVPPAKPMMVSLIAPPAPEPEIVPIIEPPKPVIQPKPVVKKKVIEQIKPAEQPPERLVEAVAEQPIIEEEPVAAIIPVAPVEVAEAVKAPPKPEPMMEDKIEPPQFGVSYLKNPAPAYPALSRRMGEEGRVLIKVLVAADGSASAVQLENSSGSDRLDKAALNAVKRWQFIPAKKNNQPLSAYVLVPIKFSLDS